MRMQHFRCRKGCDTQDLSRRCRYAHRPLVYLLTLPNRHVSHETASRKNKILDAPPLDEIGAYSQLCGNASRFPSTFVYKSVSIIPTTQRRRTGWVNKVNKGRLAHDTKSQTRLLWHTIVLLDRDMPLEPRAPLANK